MPGALPFAVHKAGIVLLLLSLLMASISAKFAEKLLWVRMYHSGTFVAIIISGLLDAFAFFRLRLFDIMPAAQAMVTQMMGDGLVVVDKLGIVVGVNSAAERIIGKSSPEVCGNPVGNLFEPWPELSGLAGRRKAGSAELIINGEFYNVMVASLSAWGRGLMGLTIVFHNISAEKKRKNC